MDGSACYDVTSLAALKRHYSEANPRTVNKELPFINDAGRAFIAASPFLVLATSGPEGLDCSPKGDAPGFVEVADDGRSIFIPDRRGNNRLDGLKNLLADPRVGIIFFAPGANETFRVNGRARISADPALTARFAIKNRAPATVIVVDVEQCFQHCPKALVRSNLWRRGAGERPKVPTLGEFAAARRPDSGIDAARYDEEYAERMPEELY